MNTFTLQFATTKADVSTEVANLLEGLAQQILESPLTEGREEITGPDGAVIGEITFTRGPIVSSAVTS